FKPFDRYFIWLRSGQELLANNSHHFKPEGVRLYNQLLAQIIGKKYNRPLTIPITLTTTTTTTTTTSKLNNTLKPNNYQQRFYPYDPQK
ncbi:unnamed protein product, partial [Rotaria socialis]